MKAQLFSCVICPLCGSQMTTLNVQSASLVKCDNPKCELFGKIFESPYFELKEVK
jgi:hypothetical protein